MPDDLMRSDYAASGPVPALYALSAVVYAERGNEILLLKRAEGSALAGQWFLPGGMVEAGESPDAGARRELAEEAGVEIAGDLEIIGCYTMHVYGYDTLQISFRGKIAENHAVVISSEHEGAQWVKARDMRVLLTDEVIDGIAKSDARVIALLGEIRADLDRYLDRVGR